MNFRVTQQLVRSTARDHLTRQTGELFKVQQQISTGLRIQRPADDPAGIRRSLIQKDRLERLTAHTTSLQHVQSRLQQAYVQLQDAGNLLLRARDIALSAQQVTDETERQVLATELNGILEELLTAANAADESGYLFSGTAAQTQPFPGTPAMSGAQPYAGASDRTTLQLTGDVSRSALLPGNLIFQPASRSATLVLGHTGAAPGTGTDTARGTRQLQISHTATTYAAGSGVTAGSSASAADSILGPPGTHTLQIVDTSGTGAFGTVSLNGGPPVNYAAADTDLLVTGPNGERVYLNTTAITPGFNGSVDITATGTASIDGGLTTIPLDFSANQTLTDSRDGSVVHLNTAGVTRTGTDQLEFPGTADAFAAIINLRDDLLNSRNLSAGAQSEALTRRLSDLNRVHSHILDVIGIQSVSIEQLDRLQTRTEDLALAEKQELSDTVSADITAAVVRLQELQNLQQYTLAAVSTVLTPSLLDYLQ